MLANSFALALPKVPMNIRPISFYVGQPRENKIVIVPHSKMGMAVGSSPWLVELSVGMSSRI